MNKRDGRALSHAVREEIRKRAVVRVLNGESPEEVIKSLGFHRSCIYDWLAKYKEGGESALINPATIYIAFRASGRRRNKAQCAGKGYPLAKHWNAGPAPACLKSLTL